MRKTGIVIPCYNESKRLVPDEFLSILDKEPDLSLLFVDDGSTDTTREILQSIKDRNRDQVDFLCLKQNCGKAEAVRSGILKLADGLYENIGFWDADLATPLKVIPEFCNLLDSGGKTIVIGSRVKLLGRKIDRNAARHYMGRLFATCASLLLSLDVYDTQCGAKIFKNSQMLKKVFGRPFKVNWTFDVEMLARFSVVSGISPSETSRHWHEYPLEEWVDVKGSKLQLYDYVISGFEFCTLFAYLHTPAKKYYKSYLAAQD